MSQSHFDALPFRSRACLGALARRPTSLSGAQVFPQQELDPQDYERGSEKGSVQDGGHSLTTGRGFQPHSGYLPPSGLLLPPSTSSLFTSFQ